MSLIADALKAAQWERSGAEASSERHKAAAKIVRRPTAGPTPASRIPLPDSGFPTSARIATALLVAALVAGGALVLHGRSARQSASAPQAAAASAPELSQREQAQALLGSADAEPQPADGRLAVAEDLASPEAAGEQTSWDSAYRGFVEAPVVAAPSPAGAPEAAPPVAASTPSAGAPPLGAANDEAVGAAPAPDAAPRAGAFRLTLAPAKPEGNEFLEAVAAQARRDHAGAIQLYRRLLQRQPAHAEAANNLGTSLQALGDLAQARDAYRRAIAVQPAYAAAWSNLSGVLLALGEPAEARAALAESIRLDPANLAARVNLANEHAASGDATEAKRLLQEVLRADPRMAEAHYALARVLESAGDPAAIASYTRFLETAGDHFPRLTGPVRDRIAQLERGS